MPDIYAQKSARPMLVGTTGAAFDDAAWLYELKLDGERCLAYLDPLRGETTLANTRGTKILRKFPELEGLHEYVGDRCILDGELVVLAGGKPDFERIKSRSLTANPARVSLGAKQFPASLVVFDILYLGARQVTGLPLSRRKQLLAEAVHREDARLSVSRTVEQQGVALFEQAKRHGLEGVVAKRMDSLYHMGRRTKEWAKFKNIQDDEFVICGYITEAAAVASLVLGQYDETGALHYRGHATLALSGEDFARIERQPRRHKPPFAEAPPPGNELALWLEPELVCTVQFLYRTPGGGIRHPVYKGLRPDKLPTEAIQA